MEAGHHKTKHKIIAGNVSKESVCEEKIEFSMMNKERGWLAKYNSKFWCNISKFYEVSHHHSWIKRMMLTFNVRVTVKSVPKLVSIWSGKAHKAQCNLFYTKWRIGSIALLCHNGKCKCKSWTLFFFCLVLVSLSSKIWQKFWGLENKLLDNHFIYRKMIKMHPFDIRLSIVQSVLRLLKEMTV